MTKILLRGGPHDGKLIRVPDFIEETGRVYLPRPADRASWIVGPASLDSICMPFDAPALYERAYWYVGSYRRREWVLTERVTLLPGTALNDITLPMAEYDVWEYR